MTCGEESGLRRVGIVKDAKLLSVSFLVGAACYFASIAANLLTSPMRPFLALPPEISEVLRAQRTRATVDLLSRWWEPVLIAPLVETLLFLVAFVVVKITVNSGARLTLWYCAVMAVLGWLVHGASSLSVGRAIAFTFLSILFLRVAQDRNLPWAFGATALAHVVWNSGALALAAVRLPS